jgi:hypothetical protein
MRDPGRKGGPKIRGCVDTRTVETDDVAEIDPLTDPVAPIGAADTVTAFDRGDYHTAARGSDACWQKFAALGMLGIVEPARQRLKNFPDARAAFFRAATLWIAGEDADAMAILGRTDLPEASALAALLEKPAITILGQLPYHRGWPQVLLDGIAADPKFRVANHTYHPEDRPSPPNASVFDWYEADDVPDFYICHMLEWHAPPTDIHEAPFPIFAHTADTDLHIQLLRRWLPSFDALFVTDSSEHAMVSRLLPDGRVACTPSPFGWAGGVGGANPGVAERPIDVFMSGIMLRPFHPDKARFVIELLRQKALNVLIVDGVVSRRDYLAIMSRSKVTLCYARNQGAMVTRGIDALGVGCIPVVARDSVIRLSAPDDCGFTYDPDFGDVVEAVQAALADFKGSDPRQRTQTAHRIFDRRRIASRYMRALTVHAALMAVQPNRRRFDPLRDHRRNAQFVNWPIPFEPVARAFFEHNRRTFRQRLKAGWTTEAANNLAREYILQCAEAARHDRGDAMMPRLRGALRILAMAIARNPHCLVLRLNYIRVARFLGDDGLRARAETALADVLGQGESYWTVSVHDDVLPPDYFDNLLDRYTYFATLVQIPVGREASDAGVEDRLKRCILASLHWLAGWIFADEDRFESAHRLNPDYGVIAFDYVLSALRRGGTLPDEALGALRRLLRESHMYAHAAAVVVAHAERLRDQLDPAEIETCRHLCRSFDNNVLPIEPFNYTRGIGAFHAIGSRSPETAPDPATTGKLRWGVVLCEFDRERPAPADAVAAFEGPSFAGRTRVVPFFHAGLSLRPEPWRYLVGNALKVDPVALFDRAVRLTPGDAIVAVYDAAAFIREFLPRLLERDEVTGPIVMLRDENGSGRNRIVGVACPRRALASWPSRQEGIGADSLFDPFELARRFARDGLDTEFWAPPGAAAPTLAIPSPYQIMPANRRCVARIHARLDPVPQQPGEPKPLSAGNATLAAVESLPQKLASTVGYEISRLRRRLRRPAVRALFDADWYVQRYPDVPMGGLAPFVHYRTIGVRQRRDPHPLFNAAWYVAQSPELAETGGDPLDHFIRYGAYDGRSPNPMFDVAWYLETYPDVPAAGLNPLHHYIRRGAREKRDPGPEFDTKWYISQYPEVGRTNCNPLAHYLHVGAAAGCLPNPGEIGSGGILL